MRGIRDELTRVSGESYSWVRSSLQKTVQSIQATVEKGAAAAGSSGSSGSGSVHRGLQHGHALVSQAGGAIRGAGGALRDSVRGLIKSRAAPGSAAAGAVDRAEAAPPAAAALPGAGESSGSLAGSDGGQQLPTTALRWMPSGKGGGSGDSFVGSGAPLGMPQEPPPSEKAGTDDLIKL
jgi:hypothetical protein